MLRTTMSSADGCGGWDKETEAAALYSGRRPITRSATSRPGTLSEVPDNTTKERYLPLTKP